jgi:hypothetical protein
MEGTFKGGHDSYSVVEMMMMMMILSNNNQRAKGC